MKIRVWGRLGTSSIEIFLSNEDLRLTDEEWGSLSKREKQEIFRERALNMFIYGYEEIEE